MPEVLIQTAHSTNAVSSTTRKFTQIVTSLSGATSFGIIAMFSVPTIPGLALGAALVGGTLGYLSLRAEKP